MKTRGFTLIELLAVIVILAIIALIATPIVINAIETSTKGSLVEGSREISRGLEIGIQTGIMGVGNKIPLPSKGTYNAYNIRSIEDVDKIDKYGGYLVIINTGILEDQYVYLLYTDNRGSYSVCGKEPLKASVNDVEKKKLCEVVIPDNITYDGKDYPFGELYGDDLESHPRPRFNVNDKVYPYKVTIDYSWADVKEYKIGDGEWLTYNGELNISNSNTIKARGIYEGNIEKESTLDLTYLPQIGEYAIYDYDTLNDLRNNTDKNARVIKDFTIPEENNFVTIPSYTKNLYGDGHTITGLSIAAEDTNTYIGLFGELYGLVENLKFANVNIDTPNNSKGTGVLAGLSSTNAEIKNIEISGYVESKNNVGGLIGISKSNVKNINDIKVNAEINGYNNVGGIIGDISGSIYNSFFSGKVTGNQYVGGIVGKSNSSYVNIINIESMYSDAIITGKDYVGGIAGDLYITNIINVETKGTVNCNGTACAGLVGRIINATNIERVKATTDITNNSTGTNTGGLFGSVNFKDSLTNGIFTDGYYNGSVKSNGNYVGGICGDCGGSKDGKVTLKNLSSEGSATGIGYVGGLLGRMNVSLNGNLTLENSFSIANATGQQYIGGLVGNVYSGRTTDINILKNVYAWGDVKGNREIGGLIGQASVRNDATVFTLQGAYAKGKVEGTTTSNVGGLLGYAYTGVTGEVPINCIDSFWDKETTTQTTSDCGVAKTTAQMKSTSTYSVASFNRTIWNMVDGEYPILK